MRYIGCHLSSSNGYLHMAKTAVSIGANTFQFFTRNPRGGNAKEINPDDVKAFLDFSVEHDIRHILAHAPYTLNACSADPAIRDFARRTMSDDLTRMEYTPGNCYNFHPGSHVKQGVDVGIDYIAELLNTVMKSGQHTTVLLETMAGKGSEVGRNFEELQRIIEKVELKEHMGVCLDTCHVWDGGYDLSEPEQVLHEFDSIIGLNRLKAIHVNDSKNPLGAHKDRHEKLGLGYIGMERLTAFLDRPELSGIPLYLETPNELPGYAQEIAALRKFL